MPLSTAMNQEVLRRARSFGRPRRELESIRPRKRGPGGVRLVLGPSVVAEGGLSLVYPPGGRVIPLGAEGWPVGQELSLSYPGAGGGVPRSEGVGALDMFGGLSLSELEIWPVSLYTFVGATDVNGAEIGPISGPFLVRWAQLGLTAGNLNNDHDRHWRVDFSPAPGRDAFTFVASNPPTGLSSAPYTLFRYTSDFLGSGDGTEAQRAGWMSATPHPADEFLTLGDLAVKIPLQSCYIKFYYCHDGASTEGAQLRLGISPLGNLVSASEGVEVRGASVL